MEEIKKTIAFTEDEFLYIRNVLYNLNKVPIPKHMRTKNTIILHQLYDRFSRMDFPSLPSL